jgi:hypothetical protein
MTPQKVSEMSTEEARRELEAVLHSPAFERSERLQKFLQYVCELTLRGEGSKINEYLIGAEVFRRGADYAPNEDSIVRRQAHALRRKLQEHYEKEGRSSPFRIELPVGRYVPVFRRHEGPAATTEPLVEPIVTPAPPGAPVHSPILTKRRLIPALFGAIVLFAAGWLTGRVTPASRLQKLDPATREIWGDWLRDPSGAVICFSNPLSLGIKNLPDPLPPDTVPKHLPLAPDQAQYARETFNLPPGYLYIGPGSSQAKMGEAISAVSLTALFARAEVPIRAIQSRFVTWQNLPKENLIVLGSDDINRWGWVDPLLEHRPFRTQEKTGGKPRTIVNPHPEPGELAEYGVKHAEVRSGLRQEYVLISMIPGVDGRRKLLVISGLGTQGTQSAVEFLTEGSRLQELLTALRKRAPNHRGAWHFQAILDTESHDLVPTKTSLVALRALPD